MKVIHIIPASSINEELTRKEAKNLLLNITRGMYNDAQIAALLTVFQMRGIKVED